MDFGFLSVTTAGTAVLELDERDRCRRSGYRIDTSSPEVHPTPEVRLTVPAPRRRSATPGWRQGRPALVLPPHGVAAGPMPDAACVECGYCDRRFVLHRRTSRQPGGMSNPIPAASSTAASIPTRAHRLTARHLAGCDDGELYLQYSASEAFGFDDGRLKTADFTPSRASACAA